MPLTPPFTRPPEGPAQGLAAVGLLLPQGSTMRITANFGILNIAYYLIFDRF